MKSMFFVVVDVDAPAAKLASSTCDILCLKENVQIGDGV